MKKIIRFCLRILPRETMQQMAPHVLRVVALFYRGKGAHCPVCGRDFRQFLPYGYVAPRENALCPGCMSLERHRLLELFLHSRTDLYTAMPKPLMLHVAPEACFMGKFAGLLGKNYITADLCSPLARVKMDVQSIPFPENSFDMVMCNHILEHVSDDRLAMRELYRVLKPGGWGIVQVPIDRKLKMTAEDPSVTDPKEREKLYGQYDHVRQYGLDYPERLREAGFMVVEEDFAATLPAGERKLYSLPSDEIIYMVKKKEA